MAPVLQVIVASTRPGRVGLPVGEWITSVAREHGAFAPELVDLKEVALPPLDEPRHPRLQQYEHDHTKAWATSVERADAFLFVIPEYNFFAPPALINALDFVLKEWAYKPAGMVSYGGVSAGLRSAQATKQLLTALKMVPIPEAVSIPFIAKHLGEDGAVEANEPMIQGAHAMLDELARWEGALRELRRGA
jgi:NAD(P)H-dependent FMN reductase